MSFKQQAEIADLQKRVKELERKVAALIPDSKENHVQSKSTLSLNKRKSA